MSKPKGATMKDERPHTKFLFPLLLLALTTSGCTREMWVLQYPDFYTPELNILTVVPFYSQAPDYRAGQIFTDKLFEALKANGTYKVIYPADLPVPSDYPFSDPQGSALIAELLRDLRTRSEAQVVIIGSVDAFHSASYGVYYPAYHGYPYYYRYGHSGLYDYYHSRGWYYDWADYAYEIRNEATVAVRARLVRVSDGQTLIATAWPVAATVHSYGYPSGEMAIALLDRAAEKVVDELIELFAVVKKQIKVKPARDLRTASGLKDGHWKFSDSFAAADEKMFVVVRLPAVANRNPFKVAIAREDTEQILTERKFIWDISKPERSLEFSPRQLAESGGGAGEYEVKFLSQGVTIMKHEFHINVKKK